MFTGTPFWIATILSEKTSLASVEEITKDEPPVMSIPNRLIFIWFGARFPYGNLLALRSARRFFKPDEILLIAGDVESVRSQLGACAEWPELRIEPADVSWFDGLPHVADLAREIFTRHPKPAAKANLIRLAALYKRGGVYLDFDTITVRDPSSLLLKEGFCGTEALTLPEDLFRSVNPLRWIVAGLRLGVRQALANIPGGWRPFRPLERTFPRGANNAVMGARAGHPFLETCFELMAALPSRERLKRFRLGTHLLQQAVDTGRLQGFEVLPPPFFYPLGPEISSHWFKRGTAARLDEMLFPETLVVHWYNSVESRFLKQELTPAWVEAHTDTAIAEMIRRFC